MVWNLRCWKARGSPLQLWGLVVERAIRERGKTIGWELSEIGKRDRIDSIRPLLLITRAEIRLHTSGSFGSIVNVDGSVTLRFGRRFWSWSCSSRVMVKRGKRGTQHCLSSVRKRANWQRVVSFLCSLIRQRAIRVVCVFCTLSLSSRVPRMETSRFCCFLRDEAN